MPWKCPVCGYENSDDANFCIRCGAQKPAQITVSSPSQVQQPDQGVQQTPPPAPQPPMQQPSVQQAQSTPQQPAEVPPPPPPSEQQTPPQPVPAQLPSPQQVILPPPPPQMPQQQKYYLLFIQTPYAGLINQKIPLNFDIFPAVSIGRSPENVIIVPDPEVSRRHASISLENGELYIEDLNSTNGTYVYDGKLFQPVKGKQMIKSNSIIKLGNQTIVKVIVE
ncbi:MAG: FHA domain-containing protein [Sulfolobus sp.]|nr:FHA domain-containing protein [Sulfolobus sp.]